MRRLRRVGLALVAAIAFSSTAYAIGPLDLLAALNPFRSTQKTQKTQSTNSGPSRRPETVAGKGYDARLPNGSYKNGTTQPKGYTPTKTRFWQ